MIEIGKKLPNASLFKLGEKGIDELDSLVKEIFSFICKDKTFKEALELYENTYEFKETS